MKICKNYINGEWVESVSGKTAPTYNPANGEILAEVVQSGLEDVERAVAAAKTSFYETRDWRDMDSQTRGDILLKIADLIDKNRDELARIESMDMGKPLREAEGDVDDALHCYRYYAGLIKAPYGGVYDVNEGFGKMHSFTIHEPVGVVAHQRLELPLCHGVLEDRTGSGCRQQHHLQARFQRRDVEREDV